LVAEEQHLHAPNRPEVRVGTSVLMHPSPLPPAEPVSAAFLALVEDLERVQAFSHTVFPMPGELSRQDLVAIGRAARLVAGERVAVGSGPASATITLTGARVVPAIYSPDPDGSLLDTPRSRCTSSASAALRAVPPMPVPGVSGAGNRGT
jgi:hypothetical protein